MSYMQRSDNADFELIINTPSNGRFRVLLEFKIINERFDVGAIRIEATEPDTAVTAVAIRNLGLADLFRDARADYSTMHKEELTRNASDRQIDLPSSVSIANAGPDTTRDLTDEDLVLVASLYYDAYQRGIPVQRYLAETLGIAISTAARRISIARKAGYISEKINKRTRKLN